MQRDSMAMTTCSLVRSVKYSRKFAVLHIISGFPMYLKRTYAGVGRVFSRSCFSVTTSCTPASIMQGLSLPENTLVIWAHPAFSRDSVVFMGQHQLVSPLTFLQNMNPTLLRNNLFARHALQVPNLRVRIRRCLGPRVAGEGVAVSLQ